jgi:hypothetical protein
MRTALKTILVSQLLVVITGCSPIAYKQITGPDKEGLTKFSLQSSAIVIDEVIKDGTSTVVVTSVPTESKASHNANPPFRYGMEGTDYFFWKTTHLNVEKYPNTSLIKSISIDTEDNRKEFITSAVSVAGTIAGFQLASTTPTKATPEASTYPFIGDVESALLKVTKEDPEVELGGKLNKNPVTIVFGPVSPDAIPLDKFNFDSNSDVYAFSACRSAKVKFYDGKDFRMASVSIADPSYIQTVKVPEKGSITMHSACGVDTKSEKSSVNSSSEVLSHLVQQVKSSLDAEK